MIDGSGLVEVVGTGASVDAAGSDVYPCVFTTYRLTEHHTAGGMSRWLPYLSELQPSMFCEVSPELAADRGLENGGWATIISPRSAIEARVLVTERLTTLRSGGKVIHQVGLPYHWGVGGDAVVEGDAVNDLLERTGKHSMEDAFLAERIRSETLRNRHPAGFVRQMAAIIADGDRSQRLARITAPTLVIHGSDDPLVPVAGGRETARAIPGARLLEIDGMGHTLPPQILPQIVEAIDTHISGASIGQRLAHAA